MTEVTVRPRVTVASEAELAAAREAMDEGRAALLHVVIDQSTRDSRGAVRGGGSRRDLSRRFSPPSYCSPIIYAVRRCSWRKTLCRPRGRPKDD